MKYAEDRPDGGKHPPWAYITLLPSYEKGFLISYEAARTEFSFRLRVSKMIDKLSYQDSDLYSTDCWKGQVPRGQDARLESTVTHCSKKELPCPSICAGLSFATDRVSAPFVGVCANAELLGAYQKDRLGISAVCPRATEDWTRGET